MTAEEKIRTAFERNEKALTLRPSIGRGTAVTKARVRDGLTCDIQEGAWQHVADMNEKNGGNGIGPNPGTYGRGALGSCLAIGYMMWSARLGVPFAGLEVEIQADYDATAEYGVTNASPSYSGACSVTAGTGPRSTTSVAGGSSSRPRRSGCSRLRRFRQASACSMSRATPGSSQSRRSPRSARTARSSGRTFPSGWWRRRERKRRDAVSARRSSGWTPRT